MKTLVTLFILAFSTVLAFCQGSQTVLVQNGIVVVTNVVVAPLLANVVQRGVYQVTSIMNNVSFPLFTLSVPSNSLASVYVDYSTASTRAAGDSFEMQSGRVRMVALNAAGSISHNEVAQEVIVLDTSGPSANMTLGATTTSTNITLTVSLNSASRTNHVLNYVIRNLDTNLVTWSSGTFLAP